MNRFKSTINKYVNFLFLISITVVLIYQNSLCVDFLCNSSLLVLVALLYRQTYSPINRYQSLNVTTVRVYKGKTRTIQFRSIRLLL